MNYCPECGGKVKQIGETDIENCGTFHYETSRYECPECGSSWRHEVDTLNQEPVIKRE